MGVAGYSFVVHRTTVKEIRNPFPIGGGVLLHEFYLPSPAVTMVGVRWERPPPSKVLRGRGFFSQMFARVFFYVGVILFLHCQFDQEID